MLDKSVDGLLMSVLLAVLLSSGLVLVTGAKTKTCSPQNTTPHKQGICGKNIPEMLKLICGADGYVEKTYKKRSLEPIDIEDLPASALLEFVQAERAENSQSTQLNEYIYDKRKASAFLQKRLPYYMRGISCECCYHLCSLKELSTYCKNGDKALKYLKFLG